MSDKKNKFAFGPDTGPAQGWDMGASFAAGPQGAPAGMPSQGPDVMAAQAAEQTGAMYGMPYPPPPYWPPYGAPPFAPPPYGMPPHPMAGPGLMGYPGYGPTPDMGNNAGNGPTAAGPDFAGMHNILNGLTKGDNPLASLARLLDVNSSDFWKGAAAGAAIVMLLNNDEIKDQLKAMLGGLMPATNGEQDDTGAEAGETDQ